MRPMGTGRVSTKKFGLERICVCGEILTEHGQEGFASASVENEKAKFASVITVWFAQKEPKSSPPLQERFTGSNYLAFAMPRTLARWQQSAIKGKARFHQLLFLLV